LGGVGVVGWGCGPAPHTPNPQSPIPNNEIILFFFLKCLFKFLINILFI
jgi:hypothetical protein